MRGTQEMNRSSCFLEVDTFFLPLLDSILVFFAHTPRPRKGVKLTEFDCIDKPAKAVVYRTTLGITVELHPKTNEIFNAGKRGRVGEE